MHHVVARRRALDRLTETNGQIPQSARIRQNVPPPIAINDRRGTYVHLSLFHME
jgi:hypothetical protein